MRKTILRILKEETEEWVDISPNEYSALLRDVGGESNRIKKLKEYRGKKIKITGDLNLSGRKDIENIDSIDYVDGKLDISNSSVKYFDKNKVKGHFSYWGSEMQKEEKRKELEGRLEQLTKLRNDGAWDIENDDIISNETEALFNHLMSEGDVEKGEDKYYIFPLYRSTYGGYYIWLGNNAFEQEYFVCDNDKIDDAAKESLQNIVDDLGYEAFRPELWEDFVDEKESRLWLWDEFSGMIWDSPEDYGAIRLQSNEQIKYNEVYRKSISNLENKLNAENLTEEQEDEIRNHISDYESLIEHNEENPEGDYDDDAVEAIIESWVDNEVAVFPQYLKNTGYDSKYILDFIDMDSLFDYLIRSDGYGQILNRYDGRDDEYKVNGSWYHVMREN
jgi:hypothetical protein